MTNHEIEIVVTRRLTDNNRFHAQVKDHPELWATGNSPRSAVGDLVLSHKGVFGVKVVHDWKVE